MNCTEKTMKNTLKFIAAAALAISTQAALAQMAGTWMVRAGGTTIAPQVTSGDMTAPSFPNSKSDVGSASQLSGGITYMYSDNFSVDLPLALPFKHKLYGAGALAGAGQIGETQALPMTVFFQYRFLEASASVRPYVGIGPTYAYFFNEVGSGALTAMTNPGGSPTTLKVDSQFTVSAQIGATIAVDDKWFVDVFYGKTPLKTKNTLSTGQTLDVTLDPVSYGITVGMKF
jgi:outer membrane protein